MTILEQYEQADRAFKTGTVMSDDNATLLCHLHGLANQNNINAGTQHRDMIRGVTINHILMQRHIETLQNHITKLNSSNTKLHKWVIALAAAALITSGTQIALQVETRLKSHEPRQPAPSVLSENPSLPATPSSGQAIEKLP
jgi:hypothetical protein